MFQDDINRSSFDTSYSTKTLISYTLICNQTILLLLVKVVIIENQIS